MKETFLKKTYSKDVFEEDNKDLTLNSYPAKQQDNASKEHMPTLLSKDSESSCPIEPVQLTEIQSDTTARAPSIRLALRGRPSHELTDMVVALHALLSKQISQQGRLKEDNDKLRYMNQQFRMKITSLSSSQPNVCDHLNSDKSHNHLFRGNKNLISKLKRLNVQKVLIDGENSYLKCDSTLLEATAMSVKIGGLPLILPKSSSKEKKLPGHPLAITETFRTDKTKPCSKSVVSYPKKQFPFESTRNDDSNRCKGSSLLRAKPTHNRLTLFWVAGKGSPTKIQDRVVEDKDIFLKDDVFYQDSESAAPTICSVFEPPNDDPDQESIIKQLLSDKRITKWFTKKPVAAKKSGNQKTVTKIALGKRESCLKPKSSQKYQIGSRCVKKEFEAHDTWTEIKKKILRCQLTKKQIHLLLELIPDKHSEDTHKVAEWEEAVSQVEAFRKEFPNETLQEDEEFVSYLSSIPDLHQRLNCMLVMESFDELVSQARLTLSHLRNGIKLLISNERIRLLFNAILELGNFMNKETAYGDKSWFRLSTLQKLVEFRGNNECQPKAMLKILASYIGPILSPEDMETLNRATRTPVFAVVQHVRQIQDVFSLLLEETQTSQNIMKKRRRHSVFSDLHDNNDQFAETGQRFVRMQRETFLDLEKELIKLLADYQLCVKYFGDSESFIPIDKKVEDEKAPGQLKIVSDIFEVFSNWFKDYNNMVQEICVERNKGITKTMRPVTRSMSSSVPDQTHKQRTTNAGGASPQTKIHHESSDNTASIKRESILRGTPIRQSSKNSYPLPPPHVCLQNTKVMNDTTKQTPYNYSEFSVATEVKSDLHNPQTTKINIGHQMDSSGVSSIFYPISSQEHFKTTSSVNDIFMQDVKPNNNQQDDYTVFKRRRDSLRAVAGFLFNVDKQQLKPKDPTVAATSKVSLKLPPPAKISSDTRSSLIRNNN